MEVPIELCTSAHVYKSDPMRRAILVAVLVAVYAFSIPYCYMTAGEPRRIAMVQAQKLADENWAAEMNFVMDNGTIINANSSATVDFTPQFVELDFGSPTKVETTASAQPTFDVADEFVTDADGNVVSKTAGSGGSTATKPNWIMSWFTPSLEQKRAKAEFEKWQKEFKEKTGDNVSLPPEYLPSAWACLSLFLSISGHALFFLMCHWVVKFKALTLYQPATQVDEHCFVLIVPPPNRGAAALVQMKKAAFMGANTLYCEFQRQKYIYTSGQKLSGDNAKKYRNGVFTLSAYPVNLPLGHYFDYRGIASEGEVTKLTEKWGKNHVSVAIPSFLEMLRLQLLSPLAIFQVFCAILWLLDEYWTYTLYSLFSVVMYEATTVFQRTRTQQMLGGMAPKPSPIYAFRGGKWQKTTTKDLLPGDIISLAFKKRVNLHVKKAAPSITAAAGAASGAATAAAEEEAAAVATIDDNENEGRSSDTSVDESVPCDCLLLRGAAVVNEASLTGESVPQMKDALTRPEHGHDADATLDISGLHRVSVLFSGTSLVTVHAQNHSHHQQPLASSKAAAAAAATTAVELSIPVPPDHGATAYVLRTGFGSSQGALLQMIEFSQQSVTGDVKETGMALLLLFVFALMASGYVLREGLRKKEKTTHELLLKCVIIITSVVPRQFPMQMAVAVNMALMSLSKSGIFCTEPYRVPLAGKVSHCLFDKTGTITTDQLVPAGLINYNADSGGGETSSTTIPALEVVHHASAETAMILAACHSLVVMDDDDTSAGNVTAAAAASRRAQQWAEAHSNAPFDASLPSHLPHAHLTGDPIELAAMKAIDWFWDGHQATATPEGAVKRHQYGLQLAKTELFKQLQAKRAAEQENHANRAAQVDAINKEIAKVNKDIDTLKAKIDEARVKAQAHAKFHRITVVQRHHFSSALQRMSVVVKCRNNATASTGAGAGAGSGSGSSSSSSSGAEHWYCLVKGSPEALHSLLLPSKIPAWYKATHETLARRGLRVLALAYKKVTSQENPAAQPRSWVEKDLCFGGFIAFECKIRADSKLVVESLRDSGHHVAMLTGDALLTSLHVAKEVGICDATKANLVLQKVPTATVVGDGEEERFVWHHTDAALPTVEGHGNGSEVAAAAAAAGATAAPAAADIAYDVRTHADLTAMATRYNLLTTEDAFVGVTKAHGGKQATLWQNARYFKVFARMSPQGKANIIRAIQDTNPDFHVFMCGDGGNDVGALKQANVGLALLAGHANANTTEALSTASSAAAAGGSGAITNGPDSAVATTATATAAVATVATTGSTAALSDAEKKNAEDVLNLHDKKLKIRAEEVNKLRVAHMKKFQAAYQKEQQARLQVEIKRRSEAGDLMSMWNLMKEQAVELRQALAAENARFMAQHGQVWDPKTMGGAGEGGAEKSGLEGWLSSMDPSNGNGIDLDAAGNGGLPMVRPGDASVAAPFTSRVPSIRAVIDLIRQGRCTLLSALMQQQIMMLESCISAYTLSSLSLHNARASERQMMASSWLLVTAAISFSYASPVDHMHPVRPLRSLFHPAIFWSIMGQAAIHITCMTLAVHWATDAMGPEKLAEVSEFFRKVKAHEIDRSAHCGEDDFVCQMQAYWMAPFMPNLLNSVVFLVETAQMISVFFANYKGRPWMNGMLENHPLCLSVFLCVAGVVMAAWEMVPQANELVQLAPFPDDWFRYKVVGLVLATIAGTFAWDRLCVWLFAPEIFRATMSEAQKTSFAKDIVPILKTLGMVAVGLGLLATGNLLLIGGAAYYYRQYSLRQQEAEKQRILQA